jgi:catechol 2,3-dioxygenase-like lactoylglutathione lyase family enzyme
VSIKRVVPDIVSERIDESRKFYTEFLGFDVVMDMGWVLTFASQYMITAALTVTITMILFLICVLDHPFTGTSKISAEPLKQVMEIMRKE